MNHSSPLRALIGTSFMVLCVAYSYAHAQVPLRTPEPQQLPASQQVLEAAGTTYPYTQQLQWLDQSHFIVGRLDGSMTIFRPPGPNEWGPMLTHVLRTPANRGVEMLAVRDERTFVTSNDGSSLALWYQPRHSGDETLSRGTQWGGVLPLPFRYKTFAYDSEAGTTNSAVFLSYGRRDYLVSGHENGFVLIWSFEPASRELRVLHKVDVRSPNPIPSPFQLWNVRDIVSWRNGIVITGAEDGDLTMLQIPDGTILVRKRYNSAAQRGINGLAILDDYLVAVACSVGPNDKNTWLFRVQPTALQPLGSVDLKENTSLPQSFAFRAAMVRIGQPYVFVTTQEGLLWTVLVTPNGELQIQASTPVDFALGDAIDFEPTTLRLAVVGVLVNLFNVGVSGAKAVAPGTPAYNRTSPPPQSGALR